jgi:RimJ/RimL family protein N-acetyltransferase
MSEKPQPAGFAAANQTFLVGENLYLRALEPTDAAYPNAWRNARFPINADRAEELIKKEIDERDKHRTTRLVACRRSDDLPVGAATYSTWDWLTASAELFADPAFGPAALMIKAEIAGLVIPWLVNERDLMAVWLDLPVDESPVVLAAEGLGMRQAVCLREALWSEGRRHDRLTYEALHPKWIERLGNPGPGIEAAVAADDPGRRFAGAPKQIPMPVDGDPPKDALMVGERVYLRAVTEEDAQKAATFSRQDTETFFDNGRRLRGAYEVNRWNRKMMDDDPQEWVRFAVVLRENGEFIGSNGIAEIDWVHKTAETESYMEHPNYRGGGYGTEGKHLLLAYAFEHLGLHQVRSYVWGPNTRSQAALRKQGYRDAGRLHWTGFKNAEHTYDQVFDLLAEEWWAGVRGR